MDALLSSGEINPMEQARLQNLITKAKTENQRKKQEKAHRLLCLKTNSFRSIHAQMEVIRQTRRSNEIKRALHEKILLRFRNIQEEIDRMEAFENQSRKQHSFSDVEPIGNVYGDIGNLWQLLMKSGYNMVQNIEGLNVSREWLALRLEVKKELELFQKEGDGLIRILKVYDDKVDNAFAEYAHAIHSLTNGESNTMDMWLLETNCLREMSCRAEIQSKFASGLTNLRETFLESEKSRFTEARDIVERYINGQMSACERFMEELKASKSKLMSVDNLETETFEFFSQKSDDPSIAPSSQNINPMLLAHELGQSINTTSTTPIKRVRNSSKEKNDELDENKNKNDIEMMTNPALLTLKRLGGRTSSRVSSQIKSNEPQRPLSVRRKRVSASLSTSSAVVTPTRKIDLNGNNNNNNLNDDDDDRTYKVKEVESSSSSSSTTTSTIRTNICINKEIGENEISLKINDIVRVENEETLEIDHNTAGNGDMKSKLEQQQEDRHLEERADNDNDDDNDDSSHNFDMKDNDMQMDDLVKANATDSCERSQKDTETEIIEKRDLKSEMRRLGITRRSNAHGSARKLKKRTSQFKSNRQGGLNPLSETSFGGNNDNNVNNKSTKASVLNTEIEVVNVIGESSDSSDDYSKYTIQKETSQETRQNDDPLALANTNTDGAGADTTPQKRISPKWMKTMQTGFQRSQKPVKRVLSPKRIPGSDLTDKMLDSLIAKKSENNIDNDDPPATEIPLQTLQSPLQSRLVIKHGLLQLRQSALKRVSVEGSWKSMFAILTADLFLHLYHIDTSSMSSSSDGIDVPVEYRRFISSPQSFALLSGDGSAMFCPEIHPCAFRLSLRRSTTFSKKSIVLKSNAQDDMVDWLSVIQREEKFE
eukprot:TRINITY_DN273_c0_g5_i1.p1 TRINITY_DN273_c0_g5~~TRINITY_DN273_c0_g5_i1.p1  ORF type:complete len:880 (+),score=253.16 TRINITY_DN273_c0_g5_i1:195-2834(+)